MTLNNDRPNMLHSSNGERKSLLRHLLPILLDRLIVVFRLSRSVAHGGLVYRVERSAKTPK